MKTTLNIIPNSEHLCTYVERSYVEENWLNASKPTQRKKVKSCRGNNNLYYRFTESV